MLTRGTFSWHRKPRYLGHVTKEPSSNWYRYVSLRRKARYLRKLNARLARSHYVNHQCPSFLTHRGWDEMATISQATFSNIFSTMNVWIALKASLKFVPKVWINNIPALVQIMAWRQLGDKPLSEPMMVSLLTHICVTWPQCVNKLRPKKWMADILQIMFSNGFSWKTMSEIWLTFHWNVFLTVILLSMINQHWLK